MDSAPPARRTVHVEHVMGTVVSFDLRGQGDHAAGIAAACTVLHAVDARFSTYLADSEVSRFRRGEIADQDRSADLLEVAAACEAIAATTSGAFSADLPGGYDPSGYVKGWSVDRVAVLLDAHGCTDWSVNAGGDVRTRRSAAAAPWRVGVRHPFQRSALATVVPAWDLAVATSGRYERGDHLIDPRTGRPARGAASATVCGPELGLADAFATAAFVLGEDGPAWVAGLPGYECWCVLPGGRVVTTVGFPRFVAGVPVTRSTFEEAA